MNDPLVAPALNLQLSISLKDATAEVGSLNQEPLEGQQAAKAPSWFENTELKCLCI